MACAPGERCVNGGCALGCAAGQTNCFGQCVSITTDNAHCGGCGIACGSAEVCSMGQCGPACAVPLLTCNQGASCVDPRFDPDHCGGCGQSCPAVAHASRLCVDQTCNRSSCDLGFADCNQSLIDGCEATLATDSLNCGRCGNVCPAEECSNGIYP